MPAATGQRDLCLSSLFFSLAGLALETLRFVKLRRAFFRHHPQLSQFGMAEALRRFGCGASCHSRGRTHRARRLLGRRNPRMAVKRRAREGVL